MKTINKRNKTGPGRSPLWEQVGLIQAMLEDGKTLEQVSEALRAVGVERAPSSISEWVARREGGYRGRRNFEFLARPSPSLKYVFKSSREPSRLSLALHTRPPQTPPESPAPPKFQISPEDLAALKAKARKSAEELSNRIPQ